MMKARKGRQKKREQTNKRVFEQLSVKRRNSTSKTYLKYTLHHIVINSSTTLAKNVITRTCQWSDLFCLTSYCITKHTSQSASTWKYLQYLSVRNLSTWFSLVTDPKWERCLKMQKFIIVWFWVKGSFQNWIIQVIKFKWNITLL